MLKVDELTKEFQNIFEILSLKHGYYNVFDHFLDSAINGFCFNYDPKIMEYIRNKYSQDERYKIGELIKLWIFISKENLKQDDSFYDFLGKFYEKNAMSKKQGFAQYFTPETICKFMAQITLLNPEKTKSVSEPTCGSGRLNLAANSVKMGLFHYANDLDITCFKMASLNFMIHGIKGIVTCDDSLFPKTKFRGAFVVNDQLTPSLFYIENKNQAYNFLNYKMNELNKNEAIIKIINEESTPEKIENKVIYTKTKELINDGQFSLF